MAGKTNTGFVEAKDLPKKPAAAGERAKAPGENPVPPADDTKDELGRAKDPDAPRGEGRHKAGDHRRSGMGTGEEAEKIRTAVEINDDPFKRMSLGFSGDWTRLSSGTLLGLIVEELRNSSFGFNKRIEKALGELHREDLKAEAEKRKAA